MVNNNPLAIITGASTGIGKYISLQLSENNYRVILISRNEQKLTLIKEKIEKKGGDCLIIAADISKSSSIENISSIIGNQNIDVLVNNAGIGIFDSIQNATVSDWDQQMNTNLRGSFLMTKLSVESMIKRRSGKIIFMNSVAGMNPYPYSSVYVASKYGLRGFSSSLREELREYNIKVISVHPGAINTPFWNNVKGDFPREDMLNAQDISHVVVNAILAKNDIVHEEIVVRRTAGDIK
jgi:3-oxoacyl-[acyl-carrier protein] reductase